MKTNTFSIVLIAITCASLIFATYTYNQVSETEDEILVWKTKYEEALIDTEEATTRIERMREDLEKALKESELHRIRTETALLELQKHKKIAK